MTIKLESITVFAGKSQETPCYEAYLFVDGRLFARVSNDGRGGADHVSGATGDVQALEERVREEHGTYVSEGFEFPMSLELLCHMQVRAHVERQSLRRRLKRTIFVVHGGGISALKKADPRDERARRWARENYPTVLNDLTEDEVWEIWRGAMGL